MIPVPSSLKEIGKLKVTPYSEVRDKLETGDLVFCSGKYAISGIIRYFSKSMFSHVGIIYRDERLSWQSQTLQWSNATCKMEKSYSRGRIKNCNKLWDG